ncbi:hypothetical protein DFP73DRAFT_599947 [Morchella snyderi]|nr:hypothetical protein DFP73DRAFT_599947 [Morchella snyderi]
MDIDMDLDLGTIVPLLVDSGTPTDHQRARDLPHPHHYASLPPRASIVVPPATSVRVPQDEDEAPQDEDEMDTSASSIQSDVETLHLRVRPDPQNPLERIITTVLSNGEEEPHPPAQRLWDMEQQVQRELGPERFLTHTFMMPPLNIHNTDTFLIVEFVDSGRRFKYENCYGVSQWNFQPLLGGVNYSEGERWGMGNLYGFGPKMHDFFREMLVPVTLRTYRNLMALLELRDPDMICDEAAEIHEHYSVKIALNWDVRARPEFTRHLVCGNIEIAILFEVLANAYEDQRGLMLSRIGTDCEVTGEAITYVQAVQSGWKLEEMGFPTGFTLYLLAYFWQESDQFNPMPIDRRRLI